MKKLLTTLFAIALGLNLSAQVPDYVPTDGLVGWYSFDSDATDLSENEFSGTVYEASTVEQGYNGGSLYFDGQNDYIEIPTNEVFESIVHQLTLSAWFKKTSEANGSIVAKRNFVGNPCGERHHFELTCMDDQSIFFSASHNCVEMHTTQVFSAPEIFNLGVWNHVVVTYLNGALKMFINGSMVIEHDEGYRELLPNNHWVNYGRIHRSGGVPFFNEFGGEIDESGIWNRALTEEEILALYNAVPPIQGCTDVSACNFSSEANEDDGSCIYPLFGDDCEDGGAACGEGTIWDSSLQTCIGFDECPSDLDDDGIVGINDLLSLLSDFGTECPPEVAEWTCGDLLNYHGYDYATVQVGDQCWFAENIRTELYANGDPIPSDTQDSLLWATAGAQTYFLEDSVYLEERGRMYNGHAVLDARGLCPTGWHVPSDGDFIQLEGATGMSEVDWESTEGDRGCSLEIGETWKSQTGWYPGEEGTDLWGLSVQPSGYFLTLEGFGNSYASSELWTSTPYDATRLWRRQVPADSGCLFRGWWELSVGSAVRCLKDTE